MNTNIVESPTVTAIEPVKSGVQFYRSELNRIKLMEKDLREKIEQLNISKQSALLTKVHSLPEYLDLPTMDEAINTIKRLRNAKAHANISASMPKHRIKKTSNNGTVHRNWNRVNGSIIADVIGLLKTNKFTTKQIARKVKISTSSVNIIKKSSGLVKNRIAVS